MIGFVTPSIARESLRYTIKSVKEQTNPNWKLYIGFDGKKYEDVDSSLLVGEHKINYFFINEKLGVETNFHGNAGQVRNCIIQNFIDDDIEWLGFVDDDDTISKDYVATFNREKELFNFDCCVFRMRYDKLSSRIIPPVGMNEIRQNYVGISFVVNKNFIKTNNINFHNSNSEDFDYLKSISNAGGKIHISDHILYNVNGYQYYE